MTNYTLESLEEEFRRHSERAVIEHEKQCKRHQEEYNEPYPHEFFDVSYALHVMCSEIRKLKEDMR